MLQAGHRDKMRREGVIEPPRHFKHEVAFGLPDTAAVIEHAINGRRAHTRFAGDVDDLETPARSVQRLRVRHSRVLNGRHHRRSTVPAPGHWGELFKRLRANRGDALFGGGNLLRIAEHGKTRRVPAFLAVFKPDQLTGPPRERLAKHDIRAWLDTDGVLALLVVLPLEHIRELAAVNLDHETEAATAVEIRIDQSDRYLALRVRHHGVLIDLFVEAVLRLRLKQIADALPLHVVGMRCPGGLVDRSQIAAAPVENRIAEIDVIQKHVRRLVEAVIDYAIVQGECAFTDLGFDAPNEMQVFTENRRLLHQTLAPKRALITVPALAIAQELAGDHADAAVQRTIDRLAMNIVIVLGRAFVHEQRVIEPACDHQARKRA